MANLFNRNNQSCNATMHFNQNDPSPQIGRNSNGLGLGQLGLNQKVTELRRTIISPNRIQVQSIIDFSPNIPMQTQFPPNSLHNAASHEGMNVTEIIQATRSLGPTPTRDHFFCVPLSQPSASVNPDFAGNTFTSNGFMANDIRNDEANFSSYLYRHYGSMLRNQSNVTLTNIYKHTPRTTQNHGFAPNNFQNLRFNPIHVGSSNVQYSQMNPTSSKSKGPVIESQVNNDNDNDDAYDGGIRSLPTQKYGPYRCPKCNGIFSTSQQFAAHVSSHYKFETDSQRKRRREAKYKNKGVRCVKSKLPDVTPNSNLSEAANENDGASSSNVAGQSSMNIQEINPITVKKKIVEEDAVKDSDKVVGVVTKVEPM